ncbi:DUF190 domain-containing protein [Streptomyces lavendofoliae]|uniref:DUF190 domain-containing protein n=1 Tax=Streptomyces lavendofoliae TaxID=67314 RepID=UPI003AF00A88
MTVLVGESDVRRHRPVHGGIAHRATEAGLAGASLFRRCECFGRSSAVHTARLLPPREDLPVAAAVADDEERARAFPPPPDGLLGDGPVVPGPCEMVRYAGGGRVR